MITFKPPIGGDLLPVMAVSTVPFSTLVHHASGSSHQGNATRNWWGAPDGPSGVSNGSGDAVVGNLRVNPYYANANLTNLSTIKEPAAFGISYSVNNAIVEPSEDVTVTATVENTGDLSGEETVMFKADGEEFANSVTVIGGETATGYDFTLEKTVADLPTIVGNSPVQDLDGDGLYEDINGDGEFDIVDVQALYVNLESDGIQQHADLFDFNGDGEVNLNDVQALYAML